jgi:hypothetical protein
MSLSPKQAKRSTGIVITGGNQTASGSNTSILERERLNKWATK